MRCPCGLPQPYDACCGRLHRREAAAPTAERLMRSRYSAFAVGDSAYLLATWHSSTRPRRLRLDPDRRWTGLQVLGTTGGGLLDAVGTVHFRAAYYEDDGHEGGAQEEDSAFAREDGAWRYLRAT